MIVKNIYLFRCSKHNPGPLGGYVTYVRYIVPGNSEEEARKKLEEKNSETFDEIIKCDKLYEVVEERTKIGKESDLWEVIVGIDDSKIYEV